MAGEDETRVSWAELHDDARAMAAALQSRGVAPGDHVAVLGPTTRRLVTAIQATWLAGATLVVLPLPMRMSSIEEFVMQTRARILRADISLVLVDADLAPFIEPVPGDPPMVLLDDVAAEAGRLGGERCDRPADDADAIAVLQFTSGSTAEPKGVVLSNRAVCANLDAIEEAALLDRDDDVMVSWLPLYHDMGLIGFWTLPMTTGTDLVLGRAPGLPGPAGPVDGVAVAPRRHGHRRARTSRGCWPPGPCGGPRGSTSPVCASP